jgi:hypothetical protein
MCSLFEGGKAAGAHVPDMTRITIARTVWWRAGERASARVCACALCFLRLGRSDLYSARDIMHAAIYARRRKKARSKGGFVMSAKQSSWPPAHRRQDVVLNCYSVYDDAYIIHARGGQDICILKSF